MITDTRETRLSSAFLRLADTLTADYDVVDLLQTLVDECVAIFDVDAAGVLLADQNRRLRLVVSTSVETNLVEDMQLDAGLGPCVTSFATGMIVSVANIEESGARWPLFREVALQQGFRAVYAIPMKLRGEVIGTLNLLSTSAGSLGSRDADAAKALTDVATIGILQERLVRERSTLADQLQHALDNRVLIEQAKGMLAQIGAFGMNEAFDTMRKYARSRSVKVNEVAASIVDQSLDVVTIMSGTEWRSR